MGFVLALCFRVDDDANELDIVPNIVVCLGTYVLRILKDSELPARVNVIVLENMRGWLAKALQKVK